MKRQDVMDPFPLVRINEKTRLHERARIREWAERQLKETMSLGIPDYDEYQKGEIDTLDRLLEFLKERE